MDIVPLARKEKEEEERKQNRVLAFAEKSSNATTTTTSTTPHPLYHHQQLSLDHFSVKFPSTLSSTTLNHFFKILIINSLIHQLSSILSPLNSQLCLISYCGRGMRFFLLLLSSSSAWHVCRANFDPKGDKWTTLASFQSHAFRIVFILVLSGNTTERWWSIIEDDTLTLAAILLFDFEFLLVLYQVCENGPQALPGLKKRIRTALRN